VAKIERFLGGNELIPGSQLAAHCYCGMSSIQLVFLTTTYFLIHIS